MTRLPASRYVVFSLIAGVGLAWDLWTKHEVFAGIGYPMGSTDLYLDGWVTFRLYTSFNQGALWGVGQGMTWLFATMSVLAALGILFWLFVRAAARSLWLTVSLASIMAGTLGNLWDRLGVHGYQDVVTGGPIYAVRDFLLFTFGPFHWPVFNFADVFLVTGAAMLVIQSFYAEMQTAQAGTDATTSEAEEAK